MRTGVEGEAFALGTISSRASASPYARFNARYSLSTFGNGCRVSVMSASRIALSVEYFCFRAATPPTMALIADGGGGSFKCSNKHTPTSAGESNDAPSNTHFESKVSFSKYRN